MRSFLTTLGVIIGVSAVIAMVAIGEGAKARVAEAFASMGSNILIVLSGSTTSGGARGGFGSMPTMTWDDLKAIRSRCQCSSLRDPSVALVRASDQRRPKLEYEHQRYFARVLPNSRLAGSERNDLESV
jgi:hypothetical protein